MVQNSSNNEELSKSVDVLLKVDRKDQIAQDKNNTIQELTNLNQNISNDAQIVIIETQTDKIIVSPVTSITRIRFPVAITIISLLQLVLYVYGSTVRQNKNYSPSERKLLFTMADRREVWRFLTYMFVHKDAFHLGGNIFFQLLTGVPLEILHGWQRFTIIYTAGVLGGSLGVAALSNSYSIVGASAGFYSILGAHISSVILNWKKIEDRFVRIFILLVYILIDLFSWVSTLQNSDVSTTCLLVSGLTESTIIHFSGFIVGTLTAIITLKNIHVQVWERKIQTISLLVLLFIIWLAICMIIIVPEFNIKSLFEYFECSKNITKTFVMESKL